MPTEMTTTESATVRAPLPEGYRRDRRGFPVGTCRRCGGTGRFSFNLRDLDMCYGCSGSGWQYAVPKHHAAWRDEVRAAVRVLAQDLTHGDRVRRWGQSDPITGRRYTAEENPSREVIAVEVDHEHPDGWSTLPDGTRHDHSWRTTITWDDGTVEATHGSSMFHRTGVQVDPAPYIAKAERGLAFLLSQSR